MPVQCLCRVMEHRPINEHAFSMQLQVGAEMAAQVTCGQFIHIKCGDALLLRRPISISEWGYDTIKVVYEVRGEGTQWLSERRVGENLDVLGPLGHGFNVVGRKMLLVGGGIGVPPLLSCAKEIHLAGGKVHAAFGFRNLGHQMLTSSFAPHCEELSVISDDGTTGRQGFVTQLVAEQLEANPDFDGVLACGPKGMLKAIAQLAVEHNVPCQVSLEERMGCGVGACLVCACKTSDGHQKHVCKDGPVFMAQEVDWND